MRSITGFVVTVLASSLAVNGMVAAAQPGKGNDPAARAAKQEKKAHKHHHNNGHDLLGAKIKQNGKHDVGKIGERTVSAEVSDGKVKSMSAGDLSPKRVKSKQKMASSDQLRTAGLSAMIHPVQYGGGDYYGYCFDDGYDYTCYWYPAEDVDYAGQTWDPYDPYY